MFVFFFFFFKQKTAYEMSVSDWSSDVCSSDLDRPVVLGPQQHQEVNVGRVVRKNDARGCLAPVRRSEKAREGQHHHRSAHVVGDGEEPFVVADEDGSGKALVDLTDGRTGLAARRAQIERELR